MQIDASLATGVDVSRGVTQSWPAKRRVHGACIVVEDSSARPYVDDSMRKKAVVCMIIFSSSVAP